jgi:hypothetical protein
MFHAASVFSCFTCISFTKTWKGVFGDGLFAIILTDQFFSIHQTTGELICILSGALEEESQTTIVASHFILSLFNSLTFKVYVHDFLTENHFEKVFDH